MVTACASAWPATSGTVTGVGSGPFEMKRSTAVCGGTCVPAAGSVLVAVPLGALSLYLRFVSSTTRSLPSSVVTACASAWPATSGTVTGVGSVLGGRLGGPRGGRGGWFRCRRRLGRQRHGRRASHGDGAGTELVASGGQRLRPVALPDAGAVHDGGPRAQRRGGIDRRGVEAQPEVDGDLARRRDGRPGDEPAGGRVLERRQGHRLARQGGLVVLADLPHDLRSRRARHAGHVDNDARCRAARDDWNAIPVLPGRPAVEDGRVDDVGMVALDASRVIGDLEVDGRGPRVGLVAAGRG